MAHQNSLFSNHDASPHYCGHCLAPIDARAPRCPACDLSFAGPGRFQRLPGTPPDRIGGLLLDFAA